ncbi:MAG TPA: fasciclin domain-containing protein, partial [Candidatus Paceibacterota bacterium]
MQNQNVWVGLVIVIVLGAAGWWWYSSTQDAAIDTGANATSTTTTTRTPARTVANSSSDVATIVASLSGTSQFSSLFASTGIGATIVPQASGKYTVFVPTDGAFSQLPAGTISSMTAAEKKRLVQYHVVSGTAIDVDALTAGYKTALSGDPLNFKYGP